MTGDGAFLPLPLLLFRSRRHSSHRLHLCQCWLAARSRVRCCLDIEILAHGRGEWGCKLVHARWQEKSICPKDFSSDFANICAGITRGLPNNTLHLRRTTLPFNIRGVAALEIRKRALGGDEAHGRRLLLQMSAEVRQEQRRVSDVENVEDASLGPGYDDLVCSTGEHHERWHDLRKQELEVCFACRCH